MIGEFIHENRFMSNFFYSDITVNSIRMPTLEHWFAIRKTGSVVQFCERADLTLKEVQLLTPGQMKRLEQRQMLVIQ